MAKFLKLFILVLLTVLSVSSCGRSVKGVSADDFQISLVERDKLNFVKLECTANKDKYDEVIWELPSGKLASGYSSVTAYFPYKGEYNVKMKIIKGLNSVEFAKTVFVRRDDPYVAKGEKLVWSEEFDDPTLNTKFWTSRSTNFRNNQWSASDGKDNLSIEESYLKISASKPNEQQKVGDYTSVYVNTLKLKEFAYGRVEFRAKLPANKNIRAVLSLVGNDIDEIGWPSCGEMSVANQILVENKILYSAVNTYSNYEQTHHSDSIQIPTLDSEFHIYGINWTPENIDFYVDKPSNIYYSYNPQNRNSKTWPFTKPFFVNLGLVMGGDRIGRQGVDNENLTKCLCIDYIRVYQLAF